MLLRHMAKIYARFHGNHSESHTLWRPKDCNSSVNQVFCAECMCFLHHLGTCWVCLG